MNLASAAAHALAKPQYGDKKESLLARSARLTLGTRTPAVIYAEWNCISRVSGEWGCCGCVSRVGPEAEGLSLEDPLSGRLHKEGGKRSHFSLRQQFKLNFLNDLLTKSARRRRKSREGEVQVGRAARKRRPRPWALWAHTPRVTLRRAVDLFSGTNRGESNALFSFHSRQGRDRRSTTPRAQSIRGLTNINLGICCT